MLHTAFSLPFDSLIRGSDPNSLHHPIQACAHSRLDSCGVGSGVGFGMVPAWMDLSLM